MHASPTTPPTIQHTHTIISIYTYDINTVVYYPVRETQESRIYIHLLYYYRFIVSFPIGLDFLFITLILHFLLSSTFSLSISSSAISASTLNSKLHRFLHSVINIFPHHISIPSQSTISNSSCDRLNSNQPFQFLSFCFSWRYHTSI